MKTLIAIAIALTALALAGCENDARVVSQNLSQAADNFEINRRIVFYNTMNGEYLLTIEGYCSQEPHDNRIAVICKTGPGDYKKHFLGLSSTVTYVSEQLDPDKVSKYRYRVTFKPSTLIPSIDVR